MYKIIIVSKFVEQNNTVDTLILKLNFITKK